LSYSRHIADVTFEARPDSAPAALGQWSRAVSFNESSSAQTSVIQAAVEMVARLSKDGDKRRDEIVLVLKIADQGNHDANTLANLSIAAMRGPTEKPAKSRA
jgi:hypothetical protein